MTSRVDAYHRSFVAMRSALRAILFEHGDCSRLDERLPPGRCDCPTCIAKAALASEEDWRFMGSRPERRFSSPREHRMVEALKHYFKHAAGPADGTSSPMDTILASILSVEADSISERDWYVVVTILQWLATNVGQDVLLNAGYRYSEKVASPQDQRLVDRPHEHERLLELALAKEKARARTVECALADALHLADAALKLDPTREQHLQHLQDLHIVLADKEHVDPDKISPRP